MPRGRRAKPTSVSGYFRSLFQESPELIDQNNAQQLVSRFLAEHPGHDEKRIRNSLANVKSLLRRQKRDHQDRTGQIDSSNNNRFTHVSLELLEEHIDDCLTIARALDRQLLDQVIRLLRRARNEVVLKIAR